ncbi:RNA methyltransferase [Heliobacillus mobilis]|uniref:RNA methyltransferase n=1 Tax=Heliobacterium mobile TaxID=28064 RepID=A0A6I3SQE4_HELMO|nr:RNA methyltransferase [Heliobacterium mobile]MTV50407.1 RNA methyltransferase [Heliobacterium mobile]
MTITSLNNQYIKEARSLSRKKERILTGKYLIEGVRLVEEAVASGLALEYALYTERVANNPRGKILLDKLIAAGLNCVDVDERALASITETEQSQGIVTVAPLPTVPWKAVLEKEDPFILIVDGLQDPGNLGTIIRTAEGAGLSGVLLTAGTVDPHSPKVIRAAMGSLFRLPVATVPSVEQLVNILQEKKISIVVADATDGVPYFEAQWAQKNVAVVIGSEAVGPQPLFRDKASMTVSIPLVPPVESLNAAIAASVLIFEAARHRSVASKKGL